ALPHPRRRTRPPAAGSSRLSPHRDLLHRGRTRFLLRLLPPMVTGPDHRRRRHAGLRRDPPARSRPGSPPDGPRRRQARLHRLLHIRSLPSLGRVVVKLAFIPISTTPRAPPSAAPVVLVVVMLVAVVSALAGARRARRLRGVTTAFGPAMLSAVSLGSTLARFVL